MNTSPLCKICKRRPAIYRRPTSGELLCKHCLFNSVVSQTRRAINYYSIVHRNARVLYILRCDRLLESITALRVFLKATRDLDLEIKVLCINIGTSCHEFVLPYIEKNLKLDTIIVDNVNYHPKGFVELVKFQNSIAVRIVRVKGIEVVIDPLFRDEMVLMALLGLLKVSKSVFSEALPVKQSIDIKISRPFYYVISSDIAMLTYVDPELKSLAYNMPCKIYSDAIENVLLKRSKDILWTSTELMYSSIKSVELLQSYILNTKTRCRYCLSLSDSDVCEVCRSFSEVIDPLKVNRVET